MSRTDPKIHINLPAELLSKLKASAQENQRTMNAEVVFILQKALRTKKGQNEKKA